MEEEDRPVNEEPRPHGFWKSWYIQIKMWLGGCVFLIALYVFSYLTGCNVISIFG